MQTLTTAVIKHSSWRNPPKKERQNLFQQVPQNDICLSTAKSGIILHLICWNFTFIYVWIITFLLLKRCVWGLVRFSHKRHLVRFRRISCFSSKYLEIPKHSWKPSRRLVQNIRFSHYKHSWTFSWGVVQNTNFCCHKASYKMPQWSLKRPSSIMLWCHATTNTSTSQ